MKFKDIVEMWPVFCIFMLGIIGMSLSACGMYGMITQKMYLIILAIIIVLVGVLWIIYSNNETKKSIEFNKQIFLLKSRVE